MGPAVALAFTVLSAVGAAYEGHKQAQAQQQAQKAQTNIADIQQNEALRERIRRARVARADVLQAGEDQGVATSSAVVGGMASIGSQLAQGAGLQNRVSEQANAASSANAAAGRAASMGSIFQAVGGVSGTLYGDFRTRDRAVEYPSSNKNIFSGG